MHTFATADATREVEAVDKLHPIHRLEIAHVRADSILTLYIRLDAFEYLRHVVWRHLLVVLLHELLERREIIHLQERRQAGGNRAQTRREHGGGAQKTSPTHAVVLHRRGACRWWLVGHVSVL